MTARPPAGSVLVVEDDQQGRYMLVTLLKGHGFKVETAGDGAEALDRLRGTSVDLVITDLLMPQLDGFGLCRAVKADMQMRGVPVLVYTATYTAPEDERLARAAGADGYMVKPAAPSAIMAEVNRLLSLRGTLPSLSGEQDYTRLYQQRLAEKLLSKVAELQTADGERREREVLLHALAEAAPVGILYVGASERVLYANERWWTMAGDAQPGVDWTAAFHPDDCAKARELWAEARRKDQETRGELRINPRAPAWVVMQVKPLHVGPAAAHGYLVIVTDITAEKAQQHRQKLEALGTLVGGFAHEFSNLLVPILGYTQYALEAKGLPDSARKDLGQVQRAAEASRELTRQVLTFARQDAGEPRAVDLAAVLKTAARMLKPALPSAVTLETSASEGLPRVRGVDVQIQQVIMNLVRNAIDATAAKGGRITVTLAPSDSFVEMTVTDTGSGIPAEVMPRIFDPFFTTKPAGEGTGLGLSVVHGIVNQHGGTIRVDSTPDRGTTIRVRWPVATDLTEAPVEAPIAPATGQHILFVDDDPAHCELASRTFEAAGYRITTHSDPREALTAFESGPRSFDILITDESMPRYTGTELARQVATIRPGLPILLLTSNPGRTRVDPPPEVRAVLKKPFSLEELKRAAAQALTKA